MTKDLDTLNALGFDFPSVSRDWVLSALIMLTSHLIPSASPLT